MVSSTTEPAARAQLLRYLTETLCCLPPGSALARQHPDLPMATFAAGSTARFEHDLADVEEFACPARFGISYWVLRPAPADYEHCFDRLLHAWREAGWQARIIRNAGPRSGYAATADGYRLALVQSVRGHLSLSGSTPLFWPGPDGGDPLPERIDRPS